MKFSKAGLLKLFQNPNLTIPQMKELNLGTLANLLLQNQKSKIDSYQRIDSLLNFNEHDRDFQKIQQVIKRCIETQIQILTPFEKTLPKIFQQIPPENRDLIFVKGKILDQDLKSYSICGSRTPTSDAVSKTHQIAVYMAKNEFTLINGFAKGIDIHAFLGAYEEHGRYIGVLSSGLEQIYPPEHEKYVKKVIQNGALISQRMLWDRVNQTALQIRNRFSAQLTLGSIFIEGNYKSGTIWQYRFAKEMNKLVFYLEPQSWNHENSHICKLIKDDGGIEIKNDLSNLAQIGDLLQKRFNAQYKDNSS
jgi:DNA protecting protein DprA